MSDIRSAIRRVAIVPHLGKARVTKVAGELIGWLEARGVDVALLASDGVRINRPELGQPKPIFPDADIVVSLGGDGTILRTVRLLRGRPIPIVGVNLGTLGFLSAVEADELIAIMDKILVGDYQLDERMMLECNILYKSGSSSHHRALNEIVVERERQRMIRLDVTINESFFSRFTADGLILATPTGSTAYSFSAGGPVVAPRNELVIMTPISPHSLFGRSVIIHPNDKIKIDLPDHIETSVGIDGMVIAEKVPITSMYVSKATEKALFIRVSGRDFYVTFRDKLRLWDFWTETTD